MFVDEIERNQRLLVQEVLQHDIGTAAKHLGVQVPANTYAHATIEALLKLRRSYTTHESTAEDDVRTAGLRTFIELGLIPGNEELTAMAVWNPNGLPFGPADLGMNTVGLVVLEKESVRYKGQIAAFRAVSLGNPWEINSARGDSSFTTFRSGMSILLEAPIVAASATYPLPNA